MYSLTNTFKLSFTLMNTNIHSGKASKKEYIENI